ncbi:MAG TPA: hemerythrin domain-containing protein [Pyrinomonadaceae bacterium]|nr:hemerythrin domain-containing protein [Pyrinomonadaceae bacterium]
MNAIELLEADHEVVDGLFEQVENSDASDHPVLFARIRTELETHAHIEESLFYPAIQEEGDDELVELTSDALKEHAEMKVVLGELAAVVSDADKFEPLLTKLIEDVRHHVEEEEGEMFPKVENQFDEAWLDDLGLQMQTEKDRFQLSSESAHA